MRERLAGTLFEGKPRRPGIRSGRYEVVGEIGRGGMGVVYRAHDPKLRRDVALKVLRLDRPDESARRRMVREARAMARLAHPNVVGVYDVELDGPEGVVVVMEYVDGQSLQAWLRVEPRAPSKIISKFFAAGRGLAAAHAAGLLHRDFKPSNVLIGADGRARVADFGLAGSITEESRPGAPMPAASDSLTASSTTHGVLMGTLDFMAPEQFHGGKASARSDQYAFCVSLWWALAGAPPFPAGVLQVDAKLRGPPAWSGRGRVPRRIVAALRRGLSPAPADRWPSMEALLEGLSGSARRWRSIAGLAAVVGLAVASGTVTSEAATRCDERDPLGGAWSDERRQAVRDALLDPAAPDAERAWARVDHRLRSFARDWDTMFQRSCRTALGVLPDADIEPIPAMRCLQRGRIEFEAIVDRLAESSAADRLELDLLGELPDLDRCRRADDDPNLIPPPEEVEAVGEVERRLATARSLRNAGRLEMALDELERTGAMVDGLSFAPLDTSLQLERGMVMEALGRPADAELAYARALEQGVRWEQWSEAAQATRGRIRTVGSWLSRPHEAASLIELARGFAARSADPSERVLTDATIAKLQHELGEYAEAQRGLEASIASWVELNGERNSTYIKLRTALGDALHYQQNHALAQHHYRLALEAVVRWRGPQHPDVVRLRGSLGATFLGQGNVNAARAELSGALAIAERLAPRHRDRRVVLHGNLASALLLAGESDRAEHHLRRGIELSREDGLGRTAKVAELLARLGDILVYRGELGEAEQRHRQSLDIMAAHAGREHPSTGRQRGRLADVLIRRGRLDEAEQELRVALRGNRDALGDEDASVALLVGSWANLLRERGRDSEALAEYRHALEILAIHPLEPFRETWFRLRVGEQLLALGRRDEAEAEFAGALATVRDEDPSSDWTRPRLRVGLGLVALARGDGAEARRWIEPEWIAASDGAAPDTVSRLWVSSAYARALWERPELRARAREIARAALEDGPSMAVGGARDREALRRWLAEHG